MKKQNKVTVKEWMTTMKRKKKKQRHSSRSQMINFFEQKKIENYNLIYFPIDLFV